MFVDASAIVAILTAEAAGEALAQRLERARAPVTSAIAVFEAVTAICRKRAIDVVDAQGIVQLFLAEAGIGLVALGDAHTAAALSAYAIYGMGRGNRAQLNLGDCFAYAGAKVAGVGLLYTGEDFGHTDLGGIPG